MRGSSHGLGDMSQASDSSYALPGNAPPRHLELTGLVRCGCSQDARIPSSHNPACTVLWACSSIKRLPVAIRGASNMQRCSAGTAVINTPTHEVEPKLKMKSEMWEFQVVKHTGHKSGTHSLFSSHTAARIYSQSEVLSSVPHLRLIFRLVACELTLN